MKITQSFTVPRPLPQVWALFGDIPAVASCMPGAQLGEVGEGGACTGKVAIRLGPFNAAFEGEARVTRDETTHSGRVEGRGQDRKGGSRSRLVMDYRLAQEGSSTRVEVDADVELSGPIAQFGRTGIVQQTAGILIGQFARNVEARLAAMPQDEQPPAAMPEPASGGDDPRPAMPAGPSVQAAGEASRAAPVAPAAPIGVLGLFAALVASMFRRLLPGR